ncbi:MAG TPA: hypothetical protein VF771_18060 [Longimicrobiaceae bacterium]
MADIFVHPSASAAADEWLQTATISPMPVDAVKPLKLSTFYRKYVDAMGIPVLGSDRVSDAAVLEAAYLVRCMLQNAPDIARQIARNKVRVAVMACDERTRNVPEHSDLEPMFDKRARGVGATSARPASSCAEENLLGCTGDPYRLENIFVHEFAHTIHKMGLDKKFDKELKQVYDNAMRLGRWQDAVKDGEKIRTYAATNYEEYWAEGVQSYFGCNWPEPDVSHNGVNGREALERYDPELFDLISRTLGDNPWTYVRPQDRADQPHLRGGDREKLKFAWTAADNALDA